MEDVSDEAVASFVAVTHSSPEQAQFFLEASAGNFDRAVAMFFGETREVLQGDLQA